MPGKNPKQLSDIDLAFEYRRSKEAGEQGAYFNELQDEVIHRSQGKGSQGGFFDLFFIIPPEVPDIVKRDEQKVKKLFHNLFG